MTNYMTPGGGYDLRGSYRLVVSTGAVTTIAARTATAGQLFSFLWAPASLTSHQAYIKRVGAKFTLTTAYGTAQETGCDLIIARSYSAGATGATAVDLGSTVADTNSPRTAWNTSLMGVAGNCRVADAGALTSGTKTFDANPVGVLSGWSGAIGDKVPLATSGGSDDFGDLWNAKKTGYPLVLADNEGFVIRNLILMGATGVGRWDFLVEWDEGLPNGGQ